MTRFTRTPVIHFLLMSIVLVCGSIAAAAQSDGLPWEAWAALDSAQLDDDNTGSTFAALDIEGVSALRVTPGGSSDETKLAYPVSGADLQAWRASGQITLEVYLPEENTLNPNTYFLGLGDVTGAWTWVGGLFGSPNGTSGWITVEYTVDALLDDVEAEREYILYLSFFNQSSGGTKTPLTESFYLGTIRVDAGHENGAASGGQQAVSERYQVEVERLLQAGDDDLIDAVARETFDFFWLEANPDNGLVKDRSTPTSVSSIASAGFALAAIPVGVERGWISEDDGYQRARLTLETFVNGGVQGERGFFYHFVDMETGQRVWDSELSSIDTALLAAGALVAGQYFDGTEVETLAGELYDTVEWDWMLNGGEMLRMGWTPESGFINAAWDHFDESMILYVLAIGSPTHPISAAAWDGWHRPLRRSGEYIYLPGEPLFVYQYPLAFLDLRGLEDAYANYWNNTTRACERQYAFAQEASDFFATYRGGVWGLSASDGPSGYRAYGASEVNHDGTIAPYAAAACLPFTPEISLSGMRAMLEKYGPRVWREYGFVSAINEDENWYSREHIGIDQGDILLMLANAQDGMVWELFMANAPVHTALERMGFVESEGDYAVTPAYLAAVFGQ